MLAGSFCPPESMESLYTILKDDFFIIAPNYNGQYEGSKDFTSRKGEASEIKQYLADCGVTCVRMIYGQSMGCEIGIELMSQLITAGIKVENSFWDGAPCIKLSKAYKHYSPLRIYLNVKKSEQLSVKESVRISDCRKTSKGET